MLRPAEKEVICEKEGTFPSAVRSLSVMFQIMTTAFAMIMKISVCNENPYGLACLAEAKYVPLVRIALNFAECTHWT